MYHDRDSGIDFTDTLEAIHIYYIAFQFDEWSWFGPTNVFGEVLWSNFPGHTKMVRTDLLKKAFIHYYLIMEALEE